ncbi:MAG: hypothetical protein JEZ09_00760 [Salinivirgaceae bacterium]|nr:hypothetical protein [Salinivirgaceae bacterium]
MQRLTILIFSLICITHAIATDFNEKQTAIIYNEAIKVLKSYEDLYNKMADAAFDVDEINKASQQLIDLFVNRKAIIYNDLDPNNLLSKAYELESYVNNLQLWYPDGMKTSIDFENVKAGIIIDHGNDIFTVDLMITKKNNGNYLNRQKNELHEELLYRIAFFQKLGTFKSFKIAGIRSSKLNDQVNDDHLLAEVKSVDFSEKELTQIKDQSKSLMNDYINFINLLTDPNESSEDKGYYRISFLDLFKDSTLKVSNDIDPNPQERWLSVSEYQKNLVNSYPDGIKNLGLNIDSAEYSKVIPEGNDKYYINGYIDKYFSGKYQSNTIFRANSKYDFKISFEKDENTFKNFKLSSIDKFGVNLYEQSKSNITKELPNKPITSLKRKGFYYGLTFTGGKTIYNNPNLSADPVLEWKTKNNAAYGVELNAIWYALNQLGINVGLAYAHYSTNVTMNGEYQNTKSFVIEANNLQYNKIVAADIDSLLSFNYLSIPISVIYHSNKNTDTWGIFAQVGIVSSFSIGSTIQTTGNMETSGYFPDYPVGSQIVTSEINPSWGFEKRTKIDETHDAAIKSMNISATLAMGISYPLDYFTTVFMGPEFVWGFSNIYKDNEFVDVFGNRTSVKKVTLSKYGIKFGISYKF